MIRSLAVSTLVAVAASALHAAPHDTGRSGPSEILLGAMQDEMSRTLERLKLGDLPAPFFVAYTVLESHRLELEGEFGAVEDPREGSMRRIQVEVRVGSREFDDSHFVESGGRGLRPFTTLLPIEDDYAALRNEMWTVTDRAYKAALERLSRKKVYRESNHIQTVLPGLSEDPVQTSRETLATETFDRAAWEENVRLLSGVFRKFPEIQSSSVDLAWRAQHIYFVDSEGRSYVKPAHWFELQLEAEAQADDGMSESDERQMVWRALRHVPSAEALRATAERLARDVTALARAPKIETYLGPVLLEGQAAGEFLSQLLAGGVANPREVWVEQDWSRKHYRTGSLTGRLGLRVISPLFDVFDDPTVSEFDGAPLAGHYLVDEQGIPARRVQLVERGILRDLLMSRAPTEERKLSNGHGRGGFSAPATATIGNLFVRSSTTMPLAEMKAKLLEEAKGFGLDRGILIRRITAEQERDEDQLLSDPVLVYEVDVETGEETLVRDARFHSITMRALRDIIAASDQQHVYDLAKPSAYRGGSSSSCSIVHPSLLLSEMELVESDDKPSKPPYLPHPFFRKETTD